MKFISGRFKDAPVIRKGVNKTDNEMAGLIDDGKRDLIDKKGINFQGHGKASDLL